jgi:hypothetical protein
MKKALKYLVLLILCTINRNTQAQGYIPMLNDSAVWVIGTRVQSPQGVQVNYFEEFLLWPTPSNFLGLKRWTALTNPSNGSTGYWIVEDTANRRVYAKVPVSPAWALLYDFNVAEGDSLLTNPDPSQSLFGFVNYMYVDSVRVRFFANANRKFVYLRLSPLLGYSYPDFINHNPLNSFVPSGNLVWIEGIGTTTGLNYYLTYNNTPNDYRFLSCRRDSSSLTYKNPFLQSCTQALHLEEWGLTLNGFEVYFSSAQQLSITSSFSKNEKISVCISDAIGRVIYLKEDCILDADGNLILTGDFPSGVLFCSILTNKFISKHKFFKP